MLRRKRRIQSDAVLGQGTVDCALLQSVCERGEIAKLSIPLTRVDGGTAQDAQPDPTGGGSVVEEGSGNAERVGDAAEGDAALVLHIRLSIIEHKSTR